MLDLAGLAGMRSMRLSACTVTDDERVEFENFKTNAV